MKKRSLLVALALCLFLPACCWATPFDMGFANDYYADRIELVMVTSSGPVDFIGATVAIPSWSVDWNVDMVTFAGPATTGALHEMHPVDRFHVWFSDDTAFTFYWAEWNGGAIPGQGYLTYDGSGGWTNSDAPPFAPSVPIPATAFLLGSGLLGLLALGWSKKVEA